MKRPSLRFLLKITGICVALLLFLALIVPQLTADDYAKRLSASLERSLGRKVELGKVHFSLITGPAFTVETVTIYEDPAIGLEPIAYVQDGGGLKIRPELWPLLHGHFVISSLSLDSASINLTKTGAASEPGRWNFASFVDRSVMRNPIAIHVSNSRVNFKFGSTKSTFYLTDTDLDIEPPGVGATGWSLYISGRPARTDRSAMGLGHFLLRGKWFLNPDRVDLDLTLDRGRLGDLTALFRGYPGEVHGTLTSDLHLGGPIDQIGIQGHLTVEDVHRWDLMPPEGQGWPFDVRGKLDLLSQTFELETTSTGNKTQPLSARYRVSNYLTAPRWEAALNWNRFPVESLRQVADDMGIQLPPDLKVNGTIDGAMGFSGDQGMQGDLGLHDAAVTIPGSPPVRLEQAYIVLDRNRVRLSPTLVKTADGDEGYVEAEYDVSQEALDLWIRAEAMKVASLHAQVAMAAVPWLDQLSAGEWSGGLRFHKETSESGWTGQLQVKDAELDVPGLAAPLHLASANVTIDGHKLLLERMNAAVGKLAFGGDYRYDPEAARPHRLRLRIDTADAADLESTLMPTLRRSSSLLARALGRDTQPGWMKQRALEGTLQIRDLAVAGAHIEGLQTRVIWNGSRVTLDDLRAKVTPLNNDTDDPRAKPEKATLAGALNINLRGDRPSYKFSGKISGLPWQSGKIDAEGTLEANGTGQQLLASLTSEGAFTGAALDFGAPAPWRKVTGNYTLALAPRLRLNVANLKMEDEVYTGRGTAQDDGRLVIVLNNGTREMRVAGPLGKLRVEDVIKP